MIIRSGANIGWICKLFRKKILFKISWRFILRSTATTMIEVLMRRQETVCDQREMGSSTFQSLKWTDNGKSSCSDDIFN